MHSGASSASATWAVPCFRSRHASLGKALCSEQRGSGARARRFPCPTSCRRRPCGRCSGRASCCCRWCAQPGALSACPYACITLLCCTCPTHAGVAHLASVARMPHLRSLQPAPASLPARFAPCLSETRFADASRSTSPFGMSACVAPSTHISKSEAGDGMPALSSLCCGAAPPGATPALQTLIFQTLIVYVQVSLYADWVACSLISKPVLSMSRCRCTRTGWRAPSFPTLDFMSRCRCTRTGWPGCPRSRRMARRAACGGTSAPSSAPGKAPAPRNATLQASAPPAVGNSAALLERQRRAAQRIGRTWAGEAAASGAILREADGCFCRQGLARLLSCFTGVMFLWTGLPTSLSNYVWLPRADRCGFRAILTAAANLHIS